MNRLFTLSMVFVIIFSSFALGATAEQTTAHCEQLMLDYQVEGAEVVLPGFRNAFIDVYIEQGDEDLMYGQVVVERKIVTEARCEPGHDPTTVATFDSLETIDTILESENPVDAYLQAEKENKIVLDTNIGTAFTYQLAIWAARAGNFFGFFG